jgi:hypothetical protein
MIGDISNFLLKIFTAWYFISKDCEMTLRRYPESLSVGLIANSICNNFALFDASDWIRFGRTLSG